MGLGVHFHLRTGSSTMPRPVLLQNAAMTLTCGFMEQEGGRRGYLPAADGRGTASAQRYQPDGGVDAGHGGADRVTAHYRPCGHRGGHPAIDDGAREGPGE